MLSATYADDVDILALDDFLHSQGGPDAADEPWRQAAVCRVFLSHLWEHRAEAVRLQQGLESWGIDSFVAHRDIEAGAEWVRVIMAALRSCDASVAVLREGFSKSPWCDQEVGVALGRGIPVFPIRCDLNPYGFLGIFQAQPMPIGVNAERQVAATLVDRMLDDKRTRDRTLEALIARLVAARSYDEANRVALRLVREKHSISTEQFRRLRVAQSDNQEVAGAFDVERCLKEVEAAVAPPPTTGGGYDPDEEPF
jgi:hypothetical protein